MRSVSIRLGAISLTATAMMLVASIGRADPLNCNLGQYKQSPGLAAAVADDTLVVTWAGDNNTELRLRFRIDRGNPTIQDLATRRGDGQWNTLATHIIPEFRVVSGLRRVTAQQLRPASLQALGLKLTPGIYSAWANQDKRKTAWVNLAARDGGLSKEIIDRVKWEAFWDAPLHIKGSESSLSHGTSIPPIEGVLDQPGLPRRPEEVKRATATYEATGCEVRTNGARLEVSFPGVKSFPAGCSTRFTEAPA
jgi:hypothetical protein